LNDRNAESGKMLSGRFRYARREGYANRRSKVFQPAYFHAKGAVPIGLIRWVAECVMRIHGFISVGCASARLGLGRMHACARAFFAAVPFAAKNR
jgi:hypothetical protein